MIFSPRAFSYQGNSSGSHKTSSLFLIWMKMSTKPSYWDVHNALKLCAQSRRNSSVLARFSHSDKTCNFKECSKSGSVCSHPHRMRCSLEYPGEFCGNGKEQLRKRNGSTCSAHKHVMTLLYKFRALNRARNISADGPNVNTVRRRACSRNNLPPLFCEAVPNTLWMAHAPSPSVCIL